MCNWEIQVRGLKPHSAQVRRNKRHIHFVLNCSVETVEIHLSRLNWIFEVKCEKGLRKTIQKQIPSQF